MVIVTRTQAKQQGLTTYFTGKPCKHGHISVRRTGNGQCSECNRLDLQNRDKSKKSLKAKAYYESHKQERVEYTRLYRERNPELVKETLKRYRKNNAKLRNSQNAKRRASKLERTPAWSESELIRQFYLNCPEGHHVDHEVPLNGEFVCGLHVIANLQYLMAEDNLKKGNKFPS